MIHGPCDFDFNTSPSKPPKEKNKRLAIGAIIKQVFVNGQPYTEAMKGAGD
jgi:hypothetical protein